MSFIHNHNNYYSSMVTDDVIQLHGLRDLLYALLPGPVDRGCVSPSILKRYSKSPSLQSVYTNPVLGMVTGVLCLCEVYSLHVHCGEGG